jgi:peptidylprolyl isomerase
VVRTRTATAAALAVAALGVGACGSKDDTPAVDNSVTPVATTPPAPTATTPAPAAAAAAGDTIQKMAISTDTTSKPEISKPSGDPPTELYSRDIVKGKGKKAGSGDSVSVQYVGVSYSTGEQFDASWDRGDPFQFQLGAQMVIAGWDQGVAGMRVGGRRMLVIPPDLAYGPQGQGSIGPNETLIFVIDLTKVG